MTQLSEEAKVAKNLSKLLSDVNLDLDEVGKYLAQIRPLTNYNRLVLVAEAAVEEQENEYERGW